MSMRIFCHCGSHMKASKLHFYEISSNINQRFLDHLLSSVRTGIESGLALGKQTGLAEKHQETIKDLKTKCFKEGGKLRGAVKKIIDDSVQEVFDYMSTDAGKYRILNPPGQQKIMDVTYVPMFSQQIKSRIDLYIKKEMKSDKIKEKFMSLKDRAITFCKEVSSEISAMENDWTQALEGGEDENNEEESMAQIVAGVVETSPLWLPEVDVGLTLGNAALGISIAAAPIFVSLALNPVRDSRKQKIIDEEYEMRKSSIRSTVCNQLEIYEEVFETLIRKITKEILPRRILSLEKMIQELCENRHRILADQETLESLLRKVKSIEERKLEIQMKIDSLELD